MQWGPWEGYREKGRGGVVGAWVGLTRGKGRGGVSRHQWRRVLAEVRLVAGAAGRHAAPTAAVRDRLHRYRRTHTERHESHLAEIRVRVKVGVRVNVGVGAWGLGFGVCGLGFGLG